MISEASGAGEGKYEPFLYAPILEQDNGTPVSVVSALIRGGHDPWDEAARLARLPADRAQRALVELLSDGFARNWSFIDREAAAKRLVLLLPSESRLGPMKAASPSGKDVARQLAFWLVWFGFVVMLSLVQERNRAPVAHDEYSAMKDQLTENSGKNSHRAQSTKSGAGRAHLP